MPVDLSAGKFIFVRNR